MASIAFESILFDSAADRARAQHAEPPVFFVDLNVNQIVDAITADRAEYDLKPYFYVLLSRVEAITYRHEVMRDLENAVLFEQVNCFAQKMRSVREHLTEAAKLYYTRQKQVWYLHAVEIYCEAVQRFAASLSSVALHSRGFSACRDYLIDYVASDSFISLVAETKQLQADLANVRYSVLIKGDTFTVRKYAAQSDYSAEVERAFEKFKQARWRPDGTRTFRLVEGEPLQTSYGKDLYDAVFGAEHPPDVDGAARLAPAFGDADDPTSVRG